MVLVLRYGLQASGIVRNPEVLAEGGVGLEGTGCYVFDSTLIFLQSGEVLNISLERHRGTLAAAGTEDGVLPKSHSGPSGKRMVRMR